MLSAFVAVVIATLGTTLVTVSAADATPTGTVMATTQRMTDATLNTTQAGWYGKGSVLALACYKYGQSVKGYYSPWLPNGGYDSLWYKASDGYWVADVDINTGSDNPITGPCATPAPPPTASREQRAVNWALSMLHSNAYPSQCEVFVEAAYGTRYKYLNPWAAFYALRAAGMMHYNSTGIPAGALVFSSDYAYDHGNGHVELSLGNGQYVSGGVLGAGGTVQIVGLKARAASTYLGWSYAPSSWPGR
ncbi:MULTISPECIES: hypothetical protein [unclassified Leifsonia]|uniref:hypothetical protein n=1 Tax=unclassified Leifsonia TaxID=2663824 RepID=UPI000B7D852E|nr:MULTISPECIES: hypothetical protein [unclassified Leifsonia]